MSKVFSELSKLEKEVSNNPSLLNQLIDLMKSEDVKNEVEYIINNDTFDTNNAQLLVNCAQIIYNYTGEETGISDNDYDIIYEKLQNITDNIGITVPIVSDSKIVHHRYKSLRGTLDKIYALTDDDKLENKSRKSLDDWIKSSENKIKEKTGQSMNLSNEEVICFPKWDGVSGIFEFSKTGELQRVLTRGFTETNEAQDITHLFKGRVTGPFKDAKSEYAQKTEMMMTNEDFADYNKNYNTNYKQSRAIVSSIINSNEVDDRIDYVKIMPLRISYLDENGEESLQELAPGAFNTPYLKCRLSDRELMKQFAMEHAVVNGLRCDGMVIYITDSNIQKILGREDNKQKFEVAYKFTEEIGYSKIKDIKFTSGLFGRINPIAVIKPIELKGNTIENISLGSIGRFNELKLAKGDKVKILYDIIPYVVYDKDDKHCKRSGEEPIEAPTRCPDCGELLEPSDSGDLLYCRNNKCPCKEKGRILNFFNKMHIDGISYATVDTLYDEGYLKNIKDIYKLEKHKNKISKIAGFGARSVQLILDEIENHKEVTASQMLGSLGIEGISTKMFNKVLSMISFDELLEYALDDNESPAINVLSVIPGIKEKSATKIISGIKENEKLIEFLENELIIIDEKRDSDYKFSVVFTKVRDKDIEKWVEENHGVVKDALNKDIDVLVVPAIGVESSKVSKAQKYDIPVVSINEFKDFVKTKFLN